MNRRMGRPDPERNNLDKAHSPYLLQHVKNPVWWQEWSSDIVSEAERRGVPIFVSSGYATCHWCHVMAAGAFSDQSAADILNGNFVCVKVDREERPDIDHYMMEFISRKNGSGGWPLNVFMTPDLKPFLAFTYLPAETQQGMPGLIDIALQVKDSYRDRGREINHFEPSRSLPEVRDGTTLIPELLRMFDSRYGGFGMQQKFPPHCTLLFLLYHLCSERSAEAEMMCRKTLDAMRLGGLNDHLQGGVFRYCVDREWKIPHFEKMLYDQAMALWCYSLAYSVLGDGTFRTMAQSLVRCLDECFESEGLFLSAFDADTDHQEGATYLWEYGELDEILGKDDLEVFSSAYEIRRGVNFEGRIHLVRHSDSKIEALEEKLLQVRRNRTQPQADTKILCGSNALAALALLQAGRLLGVKVYSGRAERIMRRLLALFWNGERLAHSMAGGALQEQAFLGDAAAVSAVLTMLAEVDPSWCAKMDEMIEYTETFREQEGWVESRPNDFHHVPAAVFDHPVPSSAAMAEFAIARAALVSGGKVGMAEYRQPFSADFFNLTALLCNGRFKVFDAEDPGSAGSLPPDSLVKGCVKNNGGGR